MEIKNKLAAFKNIKSIVLLLLLILKHKITYVIVMYIYTENTYITRNCFFTVLQNLTRMLMVKS